MAAAKIYTIVDTCPGFCWGIRRAKRWAVGVKLSPAGRAFKCGPEFDMLAECAAYVAKKNANEEPS